MNRNWIIGGVGLVLLSLSGCYTVDGTIVQYKYVQKRDKCRELAEMKLQLYMPENGGAIYDQRSMNSQLATLFSDCMYNQGWNVSAPPREDEKKEGAKQATTSPSTPPPAQPVVAPPVAQPVVTGASRSNRKPIPSNPRIIR